MPLRLPPPSTPTVQLAPVTRFEIVKWIVPPGPTFGVVTPKWMFVHASAPPPPASAAATTPTTTTRRARSVIRPRDDAGPAGRLSKAQRTVTSSRSDAAPRHALVAG